MTNYIVTRADDSELEHHGVKGQKWGVRKYKEARASGVTASKMNTKAASQRYKATKSYINNTEKMNKITSKRDAVSDKLKSAKPNSMKANRLTSKMNKYDSKAQGFADKRKANEKDYNKADKDVDKYYKTYMSALKEASSQKVSIKNHDLAKTVLLAAIGVTHQPSSKDVFDDDVMRYKSEAQE